MNVFSKMARHVASAYIAGPEVDDAIRVCHQIDRHGWRSTICPWDGPHDAPEAVASKYREALHAIKRERLDCYLSIKAPSINYSIATLAEFIDISSDHNLRIHFDAMSPDSASPSFALLERAAVLYNNFGCTLPSRWMRSTSDARKALELGVAVRLVKGQWPDTDSPGIDPRENYLRLVDLLAGKARHVAIATHDASLAMESLRRLQLHGTSCELEQLFGLPLFAARDVRSLGIGVRLYVPYGCAYLPYAISEIKKRPVILKWFLKDLVAGNNALKGLGFGVKADRKCS